MLIRSSQKGDTLIEVMLSIVILSAVTVGGFSIMNKGIGISYGVLERTETRALVSQQLELITYIRDQYVQKSASGSGTDTYPAVLWANMRNKANSSTANSTAPDDCVPDTNSFFIKPIIAPDTIYKLTNYPTYPVGHAPAAMPTPGDGLWVEAVASKDSDTQVPYIDFYAKACWDAVVGGQKEVISSTVRLYDR